MFVVVFWNVLTTNPNGSDQIIQECERWHKPIGWMSVQLVQLLCEHGHQFWKGIVIRLAALGTGRRFRREDPGLNRKYG